MTESAGAIKSFVNEDESATIVCPVCSAAKIISVDQFRHRQHMLKVKCKCGHTFPLQLEFRRNFRKQTDLEGSFSLNPPVHLSGQVIIRNLSINGVCFELRGMHDLKIGQMGQLVFTLDNRKQTVLKKAIQIKNVDKNIVRAVFIEDRAFEKELGFYLLP